MNLMTEYVITSYSIHYTKLYDWSLALAIIGLVIIYFMLQGTHFGLRLKAVGKGMKSAFRLGISTWQHMLLSFVICGIFAGLAGALQVTAVYHRLIPSISSGYGFMGLMIAMLINFQALWLAPIALFFAALNIGGIQLPILFKLVITSYSIHYTKLYETIMEHL